MDVHMDLRNLVEPFTIHSTNVKVTSNFIKFLNNALCIVCECRSLPEDIKEDTDLLSPIQAVLTRNKVVVPLGTSTLPITTGKRGIAFRILHKTVLQFLLSQGLTQKVSQDTRHTLDQCHDHRRKVGNHKGWTNKADE